MPFYFCLFATGKLKVDLPMDIFSTGLVTAARVGAKTGLVVYYAELEQQNLCITNGQFLGSVPKR